MFVDLMLRGDSSSSLAQHRTRHWALICLIGLLASACGTKTEHVASNADIFGPDANTNADHTADSARVVEAGSDVVVPTADLDAAAVPTQPQLFLQAVAVGNGHYVATGHVDTGTEIDSMILTSQDGVSWDLSYRGGNEWLSAVTFGDGHWVAVGLGLQGVGAKYTRSRSILVSDNATTWHAVTPPEADGFSEVVWTGSEFLMRGEVPGGSALWASATGSEWTEHGRGSEVPRHLAVGTPGVVGSRSQSVVFTNDGGLNWTGSELELDHGVVGLWREGDGFGGTVFNDCCTGEVAGLVRLYSIHSDDGRVWVPQRTEGPKPVAVVQLGDNWVGVSYAGGSLLHRTSATTVWQDIARETVRAVIAGEDRFVAVGSAGIWTSADGTSWTAAELPAFD